MASAVLGFTVSAQAWGPGGHRIVGEIAQQYLTPKTAKAVDEILSGKSLADAATWADEVRDQRPESKPWHYLNPPLDADRVSMRHSPKKGSVLSCIVDQTKVLRHRRSTAVQRAEALRFVVHMVGDIHQPMHVSRAADLGGNAVKVKIKGSNTNLHAAWDSGIMHLRQRSWHDTAEVLHDEITEKEFKRWSAQRKPTLWATESFHHSMGFAYKIPDSGELDDAYIDQAQNIIDERLKQAGVRLANLLNDTFDRSR